MLNQPGLRCNYSAPLDLASWPWRADLQLTCHRLPDMKPEVRERFRNIGLMHEKNASEQPGAGQRLLRFGAWNRLLGN